MDAHTRFQPIIPSLMDVDFYKFSMLQVMLRRYGNAWVTFAFHMRTKGVDLTKTMKRKDLLREIAHVRTLRFSDEDIAYLRGLGHFDEPTLAFLKAIRRLPKVDVRKDGTTWSIRTSGTWPVVTFWETIILCIVNELHYRGLMAMEARRRDVPYWMVEDERFVEGRRRLAEKIALLKENPRVVISEQGTRRRFSHEWHDEVVRTYKESGLIETGQFTGTSNVYLAMKHGLRAIGTMAHEMFMVYAALADSDEGLLASQGLMLDDWEATYGEQLSVALTDTFGTDAFFRLLTERQARHWKAYRQDSGDAYAFRDKLVGMAKGFGINPLTKTIAHSDGLDMQEAISLETYDRDHVGCTFGIGTFNTNDLGYPALSIVMKAVEVDGRFTVKLSDNPAKATGPVEEVARYKRVFGHTDGTRVECHN